MANLTVATGLTFLGLLFQVVGIALPWWFVVNETVYIGVWFLVYCAGGDISSGDCVSLAFSATDGVNQPGSEVASLWYFTIVQGCTTVAVGMVFLCAIGLTFGRCGCCKSKPAYIWCCVFLFLSGVLVLPAIGLYSLVYIFLSSYGWSISAKTFPWGILSSGLGSVVTIIAGIVLAVALCRWNQIMGDDDDVGQFPLTDLDQKGGYDNRGYGRGNDGTKQQYPYATPQQYTTPQQYATPHQQTQQGYNQPNSGYSQPNMYRPVAAILKSYITRCIMYR